MRVRPDWPNVPVVLTDRMVRNASPFGAALPRAWPPPPHDAAEAAELPDAGATKGRDDADLR